MTSNKLDAAMGLDHLAVESMSQFEYTAQH